MKIYTGEGDLGETDNLNGQRVSKNDNMIHFIGTIDELNAHLGLIKAMLVNDNTWQFSRKTACHSIEKIQKNLMKIMSHVSDNKNENYFFSDTDVYILEKEIDELSEKVPPHYKLVIPGKNIIEAQIHISRAIARRAERMFFAIKEINQFCPGISAYINRLSDYLFVLSQQC